MAKRRIASADADRSSNLDGSSEGNGSLHLRQAARWIVNAMLGSVVVLVAYFPGDAVSVMQGGSLWLGLFAFGWLALVAMVGWEPDLSEPAELAPDAACGTWIGTIGRSRLGRSWALDAMLGLLAGWMMLAAFATSTDWLPMNWGNLRIATNQAWLWATGVAIVITSRRVMNHLAARQTFLVLGSVVVVGLGVHGLYQDWIGLPEIRAQYDADPEAVLRGAGIEAPPNSSLRMVFENRLFDGGPTATFALANSFAAVLLVGVLFPFGVLRNVWSQLSPWARLALGLCVAIGIIALISARSRSALLAALFGGLLVWGAPAVVREGQRKKRWLIAIVCVLGGGIVLAGLLAIFGDPEWFGQAPASLAFRLQYWRSTWDMVSDRPLFGSGPGNFKAIYNQYRQLSTTEQIADPHNFLFETLASGGWVASGLLIAIASGGINTMVQRTNKTQPDESLRTDQASQKSGSRAIGMGAVVTLALIWLLSFAIRRTPDFQSHRFAIPISLLVGWGVAQVGTKLSSLAVDRIIGIGLIAILVHLSVAGGWTVPGVAIYLWVGFGALTRTGTDSDAKKTIAWDPRFQSASPWVACLACGLMLLITLMSIRPVILQKTAFTASRSAVEAGRYRQSLQALEAAAAADPWAFDALLYQSEVLRLQVVEQRNHPQVRKAWEQTVQQVIERVGESSDVHRQLALQRLHLYQVFGRRDDLEVAAEFLQQAIQWSPANQWLVAQLAEVSREQGADETARELADQAKTLSELGGNLERALWLQQIYVTKHLGAAAINQPKRESARMLLFGE